MEKPHSYDPVTRVLARFRDQERTTFADARVGLEPTFQTAKSVRGCQAMLSSAASKDAYFERGYMRKKLTRR